MAMGHRVKRAHSAPFLEANQRHVATTSKVDGHEVEACRDVVAHAHGRGARLEGRVGQRPGVD
jgi:hypothetical protein